MLHCETVLWGHVQRLAGLRVEPQILDEDRQEEEDFVSCNDLSDAASLSQAEHHHLLPLQLVELGAVRIQEAVWVEGRRIFPQLTKKCREMKK